MANSLSSAGATVEPSEYAALAQDEQFTGMWTQRNPLRDADVPWVYRKYYGASRFDSIWDGINREITARLTDARRPGSSVYNSVAFPRANRFYPFRHFAGNQETINVIADFAGNANQLTNPNFDSGSTSWTVGTGWSVVLAGRPQGLPNGNVAMFAAAGSGAIANQQHIVCAAGAVIEATCWGLGEPGATGTATLQIVFYDNTNAVLATVNSAAVPNNYAWTYLDMTGTAPASTAYARVGFAVNGSAGATPRWFAWGFAGAFSPLAGTVRDVTGPSTNKILWTKNPSAGKTSFLGVGNVLYAGDGHDTHQFVTSPLSWTANTQYQPGDYITDSNGNIQVSLGKQTATIINVQVTHGPGIWAGLPTTVAFMTLYLSPLTPVNAYAGMNFTCSGMTTYTSGNGTFAVMAVQSSTQITLLIGPHSFFPDQAFAVETGSIVSGTGVSGSTQPTWQTGQGQVTADGGQQWLNMGSAAMPIGGGTAPANAPTVTSVGVTTIYPNVQPSTWYAPNFTISDGTNLQQLVTGGTTGAAAPTWATTPGTITNDNTCQWKCIGTPGWQAGHAYAVDDMVQATYIYTTTHYEYRPDGHGGFIQVPVSIQVMATSNFRCTVAGTSGAIPPAWNNGVGTITQEPGGLTWTNAGATGTGPTWPGASQALSTATRVVDPNGYFQVPSSMGKTAASGTVYLKDLGAQTPDGTEIWTNAGPEAPAATAPWQWAYSGKNSITGEISNPSPLSIPLTPALSQVPVIQGQGLAKPPWDTIILWRTAAGGSTLLYDDQFPNPGASSTWIYTDNNPDSRLNTEMPAPGYGGSDPAATLTTPPPSTAVAPEYHCGRMWMINGSYVIYSGGSDTVTGDGLTAFPPQNYFQLPEQPIKLKSVTMQGGSLLVFCVANIYIILGDGTGAPAFQAPRMYMENLGIQSYDALCMVGSTFYGMSNKAKAFSLDPGSGYLEIGFPVGDQFKRVTTGGINAVLYDPITAYVSWHEADSTDTGLYVSDSQAGWFRWSAIAPPESGSLWSPRAAIVGGTSAVQSVEVLPGIFELLIGPNAHGPILKRDATVYGDWVDSAGQYQGFPAWDVKGSIGLCETGEVAEVAHISVKSLAVGARPIVSLLLDEIQAGVTVEGRTTAWDVLNLDDGHHEDPPNLEPSITMYSDRYQTSSTAECPKCENFLLRIDYGSQQVADELLKFAIFGAVFKEKRQQ